MPRYQPASQQASCRAESNSNLKPIQILSLIGEHSKHIDSIYKALVALSKDAQANGAQKPSDTACTWLCTVVKRYVAFHSKFVSYRIMALEYNNGTSQSMSATSSASSAIPSSPMSPQSAHQSPARGHDSGAIATALRRVQTALSRILSYLELIIKPGKSYGHVCCLACILLLLACVVIDDVQIWFKNSKCTKVAPIARTC
jgi:hypothetical protein